MICKKCNFENIGENKFCTKCGNTLEVETGNTGSVFDNMNEQSFVGDTNEQISNDKNTIDKVIEEPKKYSNKNFAWLILALFILQSSFLLKSILLAITSKPLPNILTPLFSLITYVLMVLVVRIYIKKNTQQPFTPKGTIKALISSFGSVLVMLSLFSINGLFMSALYKTIMSMGIDSKGSGLLIILGYVLMVFILQLFILITFFMFYAILKYSFDIFKIGKVLKKIFVWVLKHLLQVLLLNLIVTGILMALFIVGDSLSNIISSIQPYGFMQIFFKYILLSVIWAFIIQFIFKKADNMCAVNNEFFIELNEDTSKPLPILIIIAIVISIIALIILPSNYNTGYKGIVLEIEGHVAQGEILKDTGYMPGAIKEYDIALSKVYSLKSYLMGRKAILSSNSTLANEADKIMKESLILNSTNGYITLFKANLYIEQDSADRALTQLKNGINNPLFLSENYIKLLEVSSILKDKDTKKETLEWLTKNEIYHNNFKEIENASLKRIDRWLLEVEQLIIDVEPLMAYKYFEMTEYNEHSLALKGLIPLSKKYNEDAEISYMLTRIYSEYRSEQSNYPLLIDAVEQFSKLTESDQNEDQLLQKSYTATMYMFASDYIKALEIYEQLYKGFPNDREVAETYVYLLIKNAEFEKALNLSKELTKEKETLSLTYNYALCLLNMGRHEESLNIIKNIKNYEDEYSEEYDRYLYAYSLAYANASTSQEHIDLIESTLENSILKYYILAMKGWKDKDSVQSNTQLDKIVKINDSLGYVWYCKGINAYENAIRTSSEDFSEAITYYLKSLQIIDNHVEVYFSLAHCYKKASMKEEALRAFRKVVMLLPYEDHRVDPYGITVHAQREVESLAREIGKGD